MAVCQCLGGSTGGMQGARIARALPLIGAAKAFSSFARAGDFEQLLSRLNSVDFAVAGDTTARCSLSCSFAATRPGSQLRAVSPSDPRSHAPDPNCQARATRTTTDD